MHRPPRKRGPAGGRGLWSQGRWRRGGMLNRGWFGCDLLPVWLCCQPVADPYIFPQLCPCAPNSPPPSLKPTPTKLCSSRLLLSDLRIPPPSHPIPGPEEPSSVRRNQRGGDEAQRLDGYKWCSSRVGQLHRSHHIPTKLALCYTVTPPSSYRI